MSTVRVTAFNATFLLLTLILGLAGLPLRAFWPARAFALARLWIVLTVAALRMLCGVKITVIGREHLAAGPLIVASQHRSALDALIWFTITDHPVYVMKRELERIPLVGPLLEPAGMIAIDRAGGGQALRGMLRAAAAALASGRQLVIFPEGTRVGPGQPSVLAPGIAALATLSSAPIIPVATDSGRVWGRGLLLGYGPDATDTTISVVAVPPPPAGLNRPDLLAAIRSGWHQGETLFAHRDRCG